MKWQSRILCPVFVRVRSEKWEWNTFLRVYHRERIEVGVALCLFLRGDLYVSFSKNKNCWRKMFWKPSCTMIFFLWAIQTDHSKEDGNFTSGNVSKWKGRGKSKHFYTTRKHTRNVETFSMACLFLLKSRVPRIEYKFHVYRAKHVLLPFFFFFTRFRRVENHTEIRLGNWGTWSKTSIEKEL